jgi:hypothetical protein
MFKRIVKTCLLASLFLSISSISIASNTKQQTKNNSWQQMEIPQGFEIEKLQQGEDGKSYMLARISGSRGIYAIFQYSSDKWEEIARHDSCNDFAVDQTGNFYVSYGRNKIIKFTRGGGWSDFYSVGHVYGRSSIIIKGNGLLFDVSNLTIGKHEVLMFNLAENSNPSVVFSVKPPRISYIPKITIQSATKVFISTIDYETKKSELLEYIYKDNKWTSQNICKELKTDATSMEASQKNLYYVANNATQAYKYDLASGQCSAYRPFADGTMLMSKIHIDDNDNIYFGGLEPFGSDRYASAVYKASPNVIDLKKIGGRMIDRNNQPEIAVITGIAVIDHTIYASPISGGYRSLYKYQQ